MARRRGNPEQGRGGRHATPGRSFIRSRHAWAKNEQKCAPFKKKKKKFLFPKGSRVCLISPSGAGKTTFLTNCLKYDFFERPIGSIFICAPNDNCDLVENVRDLLIAKEMETTLVFAKGIPPKPEDYMEWFAAHGNENNNNFLLCLEDLYLPATRSQHIVNLFTVFSRKSNITVCLTAHALKAKAATNFKLLKENATHLVLFKSALALGDVVDLGRQLFAENAQILGVIYQWATSAKPHSYLMIDLRPETPACRSFLTNLFPFEREIKKRNMADFFEIDSDRYHPLCSACSSERDVAGQPRRLTALQPAS
jgi:hypothetical protein